MATRVGVPKKVRLACRRCRTRRIKCDGQVPACTNCAKAGQVCLDVDSQNSDIVIPRNFVGAARARIQWLEDIISERAPDVDLRAGPQVEAPPESEGQTSEEVKQQQADSHATPGPSMTSEPGLSQTSRKRSAETSEQDDRDSSFPERAHSVAMNLGMLSLNSDSPQKHYLGSSSGLLFTSLIGASPSSTGSTPQDFNDHSRTTDAAWNDYSSRRDETTQYYRSLNEFLRQELPSKQDALLLAHTYVRWIHPDFPILEPRSLFSVLETLYSHPSTPETSDSFQHGWPSTMPSFWWNGRQITPGASNNDEATMPVVAFIVFMVLNIGAIVKVRSRIYEFPPQKFYRAAVHFSRDAFSNISLPSIQALVMLVMHSMLTPAEINLWTLVHLGLAYCVELGIHREQNIVAPEDLTMQQVKRFIFFTIYGLDRSISSIQGRPLGFRDETFDIQLPESPIPESEIAKTVIPSSFLEAVTRYSSYHFKLDRIVSDIKLHLYHLPGDSSWFPRPGNPEAHQARIKETLSSWWDLFSRDSFDFPTLEGRQREVWRLKLKIKYYTTMVLLFQPSQVIRTPTPEALKICFDNSSHILNSYQRLHDLHSLHHGWRAVQNIFAAGATLIYSFWTSSVVRKSTSTVNMSENLRTCSNLLTVGGEWWPSAKSGQRSFGSVADLTMRKLYMDKATSKAPRLSMHSSGPGRMGREMQEIDLSAAATQGVNDTDQPGSIATGDAENSWQEINASIGEAHGQDMWQMTDLDNASLEQNTEFIPEIEMFLADFDKSEFTWSFPLDSNEDLAQFGMHHNSSF